MQQVRSARGVDIVNRDEDDTWQPALPLEAPLKVVGPLLAAAETQQELLAATDTRYWDAAKRLLLIVMGIDNSWPQ